MEHFAFPGNIDFAADDQGAFSCIIHEQFAIQMTQNCKHSKWLQILAEEDFSLKLLWRLRQWKFIGERIEEDNCEAERTSLSTAKATSSTQRPQTCTEAATKYYNYTVNKTDEEREHRLWTLPKATRLDQATLKVYSQNYLLRCSHRQQELRTSTIFFQRTRDQPLHHEQQWVLQ